MSLIPRSPFFTGFDDFFSSPFANDYGAPAFITDIDRQADSIMRRSSPRYEITENDKEFQLTVDVPGVKAQDMSVQLEQGGRVIHLSGGRKIKRGDTVMESKFEKSFTIGSNVDKSKITANLADGLLVVTAPKDEKQNEVQKIPITEQAHVES